jgi:predicted amidohydrolase
MNVYLVQTELKWENPNANLLRLTWHINQTQPQSLIVLPEMFATGFTMNPQQYAQSMSDLAVTWMKEMSQDRCICGSLSISENGHFYNRFLAIYNGEIIAQYDKRHLFSYAGEHEHYQSGTDAVVFDFLGWKIAPFICYDLRFPSWIRQQAGVDLMLFVANWPKSRMLAWNTLLRARAIENQCYVIGVNRIGDDGNSIPHSGCSQVINFAGDYLIEPQSDREMLLHQYLEQGPMTTFRARFPFLVDGN